MALQAQDLVLYADQLAAALLADGSANEVEHEDVIKAVVIALQLLKATYPNPRRLFMIMQEAEGLLALLTNCAGEPC